MDWNHTWQKCSLQGPYQVLLLFVPIGHPIWLPGAIKDWLVEISIIFLRITETNRIKLGRNVPLHGLSKWCYFCSRGHNSLWLAEIFKDLLQYYRRMELIIVMNDHCKLLTKCSYFLDIFIYIIYCDHDIQVGLYERHHTLFSNDIIAYMYG